MTNCTNTTSVPIDSALSKLVSRADLIEDQALRAKADLKREANEEEIIKLLRNINTYFELITNGVIE